MHNKINTLELETENFIDAIMQTCLPTALTIKEIQQTICSDPQKQALSQSIVNEYIAKQDQQALAPYKHTFKELTTSKDIILRGNTILIPSLLQSKVVRLANEGYEGLVTTNQYARGRIWFPGIDRKLTIAVEECLPCQAVTNTRQQKPFKMAELTN